jgi:diamine N-acetyltransferase
VGYRIRELEDGDISTLNAWRNDPDIQEKLVSGFRYIAHDVDKEWFEKYKNHRESNVRLAITCSENESLVAVSYLTNIDWITRKCEFSIWIGEEKHRGKGLGTYISSVVLGHAFSDLNMNRVELFVLANNHVAIKLYTKIGFRHEGIRRQAAFKYGTYVDVILMSMLAAEYSGACR